MMIPSTLCYVRKGGKTLMLHRHKHRGMIHDDKWNGLGGKMERGETPEECVAREVWEESGLRIKSPRLQGVLTFPDFDGDNDWIVFVFTANRFSGKLLSRSSEGSLAWIPSRELQRLNLWEGDKHFLKWLSKPHFFSGKFIYRKGKFIRHQARFY